MIYTQLQEQAIEAIVKWYGGGDNTPQEFVLNGYAGTGKSTVVVEAVTRLKDIYKITNIPIGVYTGKAAHVLRKKGNANAQTIHSMIYKVSEDPETHELISHLDPLGTAAMADLIIIDEHSMISQQMADDLRSFGKKILCLGDPGQLPPVNGISAFSREPDFFLSEVHRQAADSPIIELATWAREGKRLPIGYNKGGVRVLMLTNHNAEAIYNPNTQVLCGLNRVRWAITQMMRKRLGFLDTMPEVGERIMCCKNNKEKNLWNGIDGKLLKIQQSYDNFPIYDVEMDGQITKDLKTDHYLFRQHFDNGASKQDYKKRLKNWFDWAYCVSVHKSQGSGYDDVTLIDNSGSFREHARNHLYTAITRAERNLTILMEG